jgi:hypothetical protein
MRSCQCLAIPSNQSVYQGETVQADVVSRLMARKPGNMSHTSDDSAGIEPGLSRGFVSLPETITAMTYCLPIRSHIQ